MADLPPDELEALLHGLGLTGPRAYQGDAWRERVSEWAYKEQQEYAAQHGLPFAQAQRQWLAGRCGVVLPPRTTGA